MTSVYDQMIDKLIYYINESLSRIDLIFSTNVNLTGNWEVAQFNHLTKNVIITLTMEP